MDPAAPELRLAGGSLTLLSPVCRVRRGSDTVELPAGPWRREAGDLRCEAGPLSLRLRLRSGRAWEELSLDATSAEAAEVVALGLRFQPSTGGEPPTWLLYDGYQSWDRAGVARLGASGRRSWWRCGLAGADGAGVALVAGSAKSHLTAFDATAAEVSWLQVAPAAGDREQPVWCSAENPEFRSEPLRVAAGPDVRVALGECLPKLARSPRRPSPRGWLSWYDLGIFVDQAAVLANSELLPEDVAGDGKAVIQVDDGWQLSYGDWRPNTKFPDLAGLCRELTARGQIPGIWTAPFLVSAGSDLAAAAPERWFLARPGGGRLVDPQHTVFGPMFVLDPREQAVRRHLTAVFRNLRELGFRHLKIDFLYAGAYAGVEAFRAGLAAIRRGAGADAYLLACGAPLLPVAGVADGCRIGPDTCTPWPDFATGEAQPTFFGDEVVDVIRNVAARADLGPWFQTDPDAAVAGGTVSLAQARQLLTAVALCGGLYFLSDDLRSLPPDRQALVANPALAGIAAGGPARPDWEPDERDRPAAAWRRADGLVALFNHGSGELTRRLELPPGSVARDLWTGALLGADQGSLEVTAAPQDVRLIRFEGG